MKFSFDDSKGKEELLAKYSEEEIMSTMGVPVSEERFCSPFREDNNPTCSLARLDGTGSLYFMDWAVLTNAVDVFGLYQYLYGCTFSEAVQGIWELMEDGSKENLDIQAIGEKKFSEVRLSVEPYYWTFKDLKWWNAFGISRSTLDYYNVMPAYRVWIGDDIVYVRSNEDVYPAYIYYGTEDLKVYFPFRKTNRFLHSNALSIQGLKQLPSSSDLLIITKSKKDIMLFHEYGYAAIAPQSETIIVEESVIKGLQERFDNVVAFFDNDRVGLQALRKYKAMGLDVHICPRHSAKDPTDYYRKYGAEQTDRMLRSKLSRYINAH